MEYASNEPPARVMIDALYSPDPKHTTLHSKAIIRARAPDVSMQLYQKKEYDSETITAFISFLVCERIIYSRWLRCFTWSQGWIQVAELLSLDRVRLGLLLVEPWIRLATEKPVRLARLWSYQRKD